MFITNYQLFENVNKSKSLLKQLNIPENNSDYLKIRNLLSSNSGYVYWFTKLFFVDKIPYAELETVWNLIKNNRNIIQQFSKPVVDMSNIEEFYDMFDSIQNKNKYTRIYNEFPSAQKRLIDINDTNIQSLLTILGENPNKENFFKKVSSYKTKESIVNALNRFVHNKVGNNFTEILNSIKSTKAKIEYQDSDNDIIIVSVDYNSLVKLGGDTSWCIVRSEYTYNSYVSGALSKQFIIFLTDKKDNYSKIGVTTNIKGYSTAHLKNDAYYPLKDLKSLLNDRSVNIGILYPNKENVTYDMFNSTPIDVLLEIGFSKEEIFEHKKVYMSNDLSSLTKDDIEKYDLLDKLEVNRLSDLSAYSKKEIIDKQMFVRVKYLTLPDLKTFGFTPDEIDTTNILKYVNGVSLSMLGEFGYTKQDIIKYDFLNILPVNLNGLVTCGFTYDDENLPYDAIIEELNSLDSRVLRDVALTPKKLKNKRIYKKIKSAIWSLSPEYNIVLIKFFKLDKTDVSLDNILSLKLDIKKRIDFAIELGYDLNVDLLTSLVGNDSKIYYTKIYSLYPKFKNLVVDKLISIAVTCPFSYEEISEFDHFDKNDYDKIYQICQQRMIENVYKLKLEDNQNESFIKKYNYILYHDVAPFLN